MERSILKIKLIVLKTNDKQENRPINVLHFMSVQNGPKTIRDHRTGGLFGPLYNHYKYFIWITDPQRTDPKYLNDTNNAGK